MRHKTSACNGIEGGSDGLFRTLPCCDQFSLTRFRPHLGGAGAEELPAPTIKAATTIKASRPSELERMVVDRTGREKPQFNPAEGRHLEIARYELVKTAKAEGVRNRQLERVTVIDGRKKPEPVTLSQRRLLDRWQAVEPSIDLLKDEHGMHRSDLKGTLSNGMIPILTTVGYKLPWVMRWITAFRAEILAVLLAPVAAHPVAAPPKPIS